MSGPYSGRYNDSGERGISDAGPYAIACLTPKTRPAASWQALALSQPRRGTRGTRESRLDRAPLETDDIVDRARSNVSFER
jgi:hypothetical protein